MRKKYIIPRGDPVNIKLGKKFSIKPFPQYPDFLRLFFFFNEFKKIKSFFAFVTISL